MGYPVCSFGSTKATDLAEGEMGRLDAAFDECMLERLLCSCNTPGRRKVESDGEMDSLGTDGEVEETREETGRRERSFGLGETSLLRAVRGDEEVELASSEMGGGRDKFSVERDARVLSWARVSSSLDSSLSSPLSMSSAWTTELC